MGQSYDYKYQWQSKQSQIIHSQGKPFYKVKSEGRQDQKFCILEHPSSKDLHLHSVQLVEAGVTQGLNRSGTELHSADPPIIHDLCPLAPPRCIGCRRLEVHSGLRGRVLVRGEQPGRLLPVLLARAPDIATQPAARLRFVMPTAGWASAMHWIYDFYLQQTT